MPNPGDPPIADVTSTHVVHERIVRIWPNESACQRFAQRLAGLPALRSAFIDLRGGLGSGKTTLVRHLLRALGVEGRVKSPTYAVVEPYELPGLNVWHFDFYRFQNPHEWDDAGFRDIFSSPGLRLAEWPEHVATRIPAADLSVELTLVDECQRRATLTARSEVGIALLSAAEHDTTTPPFR